MSLVTAMVDLLFFPWFKCNKSDYFLFHMILAGQTDGIASWQVPFV
jgi:hypothetical protein